jgi:iron complex outermembrane receptor protein
VEITVLDAAGTTIAGGFSGQDGTFRITEIPAGTYTLRFNSAGWRTHDEPGVVVTQGQVTSLTIDLAEQLFSMNPLTATVQRGVEQKLLEAPASVHVVDAIQIKSKASLSTTDFIDNVSGVDVITTGVQGNYFVTRGFNNIFSGAVMYLTDYRIARVPSLRANISHLNPTVPADIGRIEVVLGPGSAVYGPNTANGVVHQITTSPIDDPGLVLSVAGGARNQPSSGVGPITVPDNSKGLFQTQGRVAFKTSDKFGIKVSGQYLGGTDFIFIDPDEFALQQAAQACLADPSSVACLAFPPTVTAEDLARVGVRDSTLNNWSVDVRADWRPSDETSVIFSYGHTTSGTSIDLTGIGAGQVDNWSYDYFQTRVHWKEFFANVYFNRSNAGDTYLLRSGEPIVDKSNVFATQLQNTSFLGARQTFTYGVDFLQTTPRTEGTINGVNEDNDNISQVGGFVQSQTALSQKFDLVLALRAPSCSSRRRSRTCASRTTGPSRRRRPTTSSSTCSPGCCRSRAHPSPIHSTRRERRTRGSRTAGRTAGPTSSRRSRLCSGVRIRPSRRPRPQTSGRWRSPPPEPWIQRWAPFWGAFRSRPRNRWGSSPPCSIRSP